jgi:O-antigen/teichoic acid export membrane protein
VSTLVLVLGGGLTGYMLSILVVTGMAVAANWRFSGVRFPRPHISIAPLLSLLKLGLPFLGWSLMTQFYGQISTILLAALASGDVVGWYGAANRIIAVPAFAPTLLIVPLLPALTRCQGDLAVFRRTLSASLRATVLVTFPFCAAIIAAAPAIPHFLGWPTEFDAAAVPMTIQAPHLTLVALDMVFATALIALGMERKWLVVGVIACVVGATLNWIAIPYTQVTWGNGSIGAAVATIASECVMLVGALLLIPRRMLDRSAASLMLRIVMAAVPFVAITRLGLGMDMPLLIAGPLGALVFLLGALALRVVTIADIRAAQQFVSHGLSSKFGGIGKHPLRGLVWLKR